MHQQNVNIPNHVPADLVRDVDLYDLANFRKDPRGALAALHSENPDIFFTPHYGGFWVFNRSDLILEGLNNHGQLSSQDAVFIPRPPAGLRLPPAETDPPVHTSYRRPLNQALSPQAVQRLTKTTRELTIELVDGLKRRGQCEFVGEFARQVPVRVFLTLVDFPVSDHPYLVDLGARLNHPTDLEERQKAFHGIFEYVKPYVRARYERPSNDLVSAVCQIQVGDRRITLDEAIDESGLLLIGGLDTIASTMTWIALFLAENDAHRKQLIEEPSLIPAAIEELLRVTAIVSLGRIATTDMEVAGVRIKRGDRVLLMCSLAGLDQRQWPEPLKVDFRRDTRNHAAFGKGIHRCPGANLARAELRVFLEEWLRRIPDFSVLPGWQFDARSGSVLTIGELKLVWPASPQG